VAVPPGRETGRSDVIVAPNTVQDFYIHNNMLIHVEEMQQDAQQVQSGLRPGQVVVDVGGGEDEQAYTGTVDPATLDVLDWAFYSRTAKLMGQQFTMFSSKPIPRDKDTGRTLHQGDLASADLSGYYAAGSVFGPYL
jgi:hypothetical protein